MATDQTARVIGAFARRNRVDITCNLVFPKERLKLMPTNGNLNFCASFHPHLWPSVEAFIEKAIWVRDQDFPIAVVGIVGYPPYLKRIAEWSKMMRAAGLTTNVLRFGGKWNGREYPQAYTDAETALVLEWTAEPELVQENLDLYLREKSPRGRMCRAGKDYLYLRWDGKAFRCPSAVRSEPDCLGNIFDGITMLESAIPCTGSVCTCSDVWQYIEEGPSCAPSS
jgi:hypothetical protein